MTRHGARNEKTRRGAFICFFDVNEEILEAKAGTPIVNDRNLILRIIKDGI